MSEQFKPYVPDNKNLPEFTIQAVLLGIILSAIMCAANIYVALAAGMTVAAAIPASVISMGILRGILKRGSILENNVVHTAASSGESLAGGVVFTVPAIVLLSLWDHFHFWETTLIALAGGIMGVVMMIPLRKSMIIERKELTFPEGIACAEVLKAGDKGGAEMVSIFLALIVGGVFKALVSVVGLFKGTVEYAGKVGKTAFYVGTDVSPMLMAVGFIIGFEISLLVVIGTLVSYLGGITVFAWGADFTTAGTLDIVWDLWDTKVRFFGIGGMVVAGTYSLIKITTTITDAIKAAFGGMRNKLNATETRRTEKGITGKLLLTLLLASLGLSAIVYFWMTQSLTAALITSFTLFVLAFFFVAISSYIAGLIGTSNNPISGMAICTVLVTAGLMLILGFTGKMGMLATLGVAGVVCCAAALGGDISQDLKIGYLLGATPKKLQYGELLGVISAAAIVAPTLTLLHKAYGIGIAVRDGVQPLKAPQGVMFEKLVGGIFGSGTVIPWDLVGYGAMIGVIIILIDHFFLEPKDSKFRLHPMPFAVGMYLPMPVTLPIFIGGVVYKLVEMRLNAKKASEDIRKKVIHKGFLLASGLVAGEAIMGIIIAFFVIAGFNMPYMKEWLTHDNWVSLVSVVAIVIVLFGLARQSFSSFRNK